MQNTKSKNRPLTYLVAGFGFSALLAGAACDKDKDGTVTADETGQKVKDDTKAAGQAIKEGAVVAGEAVKDGTVATGQAIKEGAGDAKDAIVGGTENAKDWADGRLKELDAKISATSDKAKRDKVEPMRKKLQTLREDMSTKTGQAWEDSKKEFTELEDKIRAEL